MMKRNLPYLLLIISVPLCLYLGAFAQESSGDGAAKDATSIEKREGSKTDISSGKEESAIDRGAKSDDVKKETKKKAERKKKEVKKQAEKKPEKKPEDKKKDTVKKEEQKENIPEESLDRASGDSLLMLDDEGIKYNRIPDITIKKEEPGQDLVRIPDDKITDASKKDEKKSEGIFGKKTSTVAGWAIVICIFIIFAIYSKTRTRRSRRKGSRIITKR